MYSTVDIAELGGGFVLFSYTEIPAQNQFGYLFINT